MSRGVCLCPDGISVLLNVFVSEEFLCPKVCVSQGVCVCLHRRVCRTFVTPSIMRACFDQWAPVGYSLISMRRVIDATRFEPPSCKNVKQE